MNSMNATLLSSPEEKGNAPKSTRQRVASGRKSRSLDGEPTREPLRSSPHQQQSINPLSHFVYTGEKRGTLAHDHAENLKLFPAAMFWAASEGSCDRQ